MSSLFRLLIIASCGISSGLGIVEGFSASASVGIRRASTASASARNIMNPPPPPPPPPPPLPPSSSSSLPTNFGRGRGGWGRGGGRGRGRGRYGHGRGQGRGGGRGGRGRGRGGRGRGPVRMPNAALQYDRSQYDRIEEIIGYDDSQAANTGSTEMINIAVEGCCHGELEIIYDRLLDYEQEQGTKIDLLICCGDFQSIRNELDYLSCSIPPKYQKLGTFCKYYGSSSSSNSTSTSTTSTNTTRMAPIPTIFIGGNHEAMQPLRELYYGGYVAPNIYYLGSAGCIQYRGIRIGGISGIYKAHDYTKGHCETIPYGLVNRNDLKSAYHVRTVDIARMKLLQPQPPHAQNTTTTTPRSRPRNRFDIVVSHDWPCGIEQHGNTAQLIRKKPFFKQEIHNNDLGSPPNREVLDRVQPKYWFAAHLHVKFHASVIHPPQQQQHQQQRDIDGTATVSSQKSAAASSSSSSLLIPSQAMTSATTESDTRRNNKAIANADADADADGFIAFNDNTPFATATATATATAVAATTAAPAPAPAPATNGKEHTNINTDKPNRTTTEFHGMETDRKCLPSNDEMIYVPDLVEQMTKFLALDKCLPRRQFLSVLKLKVPTKDASNDTKGNTTDAKGTQDEEDNNDKEDDDNNITLIENQNKKSNKVKEYHIEYDPEWLAILRKTHHWNTRQRYQHPISKEANNLTIKDSDIDWIIRRLKDVSATDTTNSNTNNNDDDDRSFLEIPRDFVPTVPYYNDKAFVNSNNKNQKQKYQPLPVMGNPQTDRFLNMLQLDHIITQPYDPVFTPERISEMLLGQQQQCQEQQQEMFYHNGRDSSTNTNSTSKHNNIDRTVVVPLPVSLPLPLPPPPPPPTNIVAPDSNEIELDDDDLVDDDDNNDDNEIDIDIDMDDEDEENAAGDNDDNSDNNISDRDMQTKSNNIPTKTATTIATSCNAIIDDDGNNNNDDNNEIDIDNLSREDDNDNVDDADDGNSEIMTVKKARLGI